MQYGSVSYTGKSWRIDGEAFVRARLKRVFPRVPQHAGAALELSASPENTRELQWFLQRYPMAIDRPDVMESLAREHVDSEQALADLLAGVTERKGVVLAEPAREYQAFAAQMLVLRGGLLLSDDLGLGKTVSAIAAMVMAGCFPVAVVCPPHLMRQWSEQLKRFAPELSVHLIKKGSPYDLMPRKRANQIQLLEPKLPDVLIFSYHRLRGWAEQMAGVIQMAVFDECQQLRSPETAIYQAADVVARGARFRLGLSATPIHNYGNEFFHVLNVLKPDALGEYQEFIREWCTPQSNGKASLNDPSHFGSYLRREGLMLRRTRKEVGRELPKLTKIVHEIDADETALNDLKGDAVALARIVLAHNEQFRGQKMQAAGEFDALMRQATGVAKAPYVVEFMKMLLDSGERVVLYGWHRAVYSIWLDGLREFNPVLYTGTESPNQKEAAKRAFVSGASQLLIVSLRSGAGLDGLQEVCHTVAFGELDWSPSVHNQCIGRVDRDGQDTPCTAYFLVSDHGADPIMAEVLGIKREQMDGVIEENIELIERIDTGENSLQRLAREFLAKRGEPTKAASEVAA